VKRKSFPVPGAVLKIQSLLGALVIALLLIVQPTATFASGSLSTFDSETVAQRHCPRDVVVWLNTKTGIYHEKGMRWYGRTKHGAFVCKAEADAAGDRDTRNGQ
jgi:hypothetical protein